jgi:cytochrome oxidase Cu insertion factor (SCO1/SenC/PrrC family)
MTAMAQPSKFRSRLTLLLIVAMFFGSFGIAAWLRFTGWMPAHTRNLGQMLQPPVALADLDLRKADGQAYAWVPDRNRWHVLVTPATDCQSSCVALYDRLHRLWLSEGQKAGRLEVLWFGPLPAGAQAYAGLTAMAVNPTMASRLPESATGEAVPAYLVDPDGFVALHYRAGFDVADVRKDLSHLLK